MGKFTKYMIGAVVVVVGIVGAGLLLKWGAENDVAFLKDAREGFDA